MQAPFGSVVRIVDWKVSVEVLWPSKEESAAWKQASILGDCTSDWLLGIDRSALLVCRRASGHVLLSFDGHGTHWQCRI